MLHPAHEADDDGLRPKRRHSNKYPLSGTQCLGDPEDLASRQGDGECEGEAQVQHPSTPQADADLREDGGGHPHF